MSQLENKKIVISGGSKGIGLAVAQKCAEEGAKLVMVAREERDLRKAVEELKGSNRRHKYYAVDVSDEGGVEEMVRSIKRDWSLIDGLVNCAGIYGPIGRIDEVDSREFVNAIHVNLLGTFYMCHYLIPLLKKSRRGKIINFAGGGAASPFPYYSAYSVSKVGIVRLTENMALELAQDRMDINAIAPGFVVTRLHQQTIEAGVARAGEDFFKKTLDEIKKGGVPPEKAASLVVFLLSERSDGVSGKFISASWDAWNEDAFISRLKTDKDFATIRRIDDKTFFKKENG